jgi:hypothetical protein
MWYQIKNELALNKFSLLLAAFAVASLLTIHTMWGDWYDGGQVRTLILLMCVMAVLLTLHVNRIYTGGSPNVSSDSALARAGVTTLFWAGSLGAFCLMGRAAGFMSAETMYGLLSASGLLAGLNAVFAVASRESGGDGRSRDLERLVGSLFEVLLIGAVLFWAILLSGYVESASPLRSFLLYVFFTPVGALAHLLLGGVLCGASFLVIVTRRSFGTSH